MTLTTNPWKRAAWTLEKVPMSGRGGARHKAKPYVDTDLLFSVFSSHEGLVSNLGSYKHVSRSQVPCPRGLVYTMPLWSALVRVEPSGEVHTQPMRTALLSLLSQKPSLNQTPHTGEVWANLKTERIGCILTHVRKCKRDHAQLQVAAAKLSREEFEQFKKHLNMLDLPATLPLAKGAKAAASLEKEPSLEKENCLESEPLAKPLGKGSMPSAQSSICLEKHPAEGLGKGCKRKLKEEESDISLDKHGFPKMFGSPEAAKAASLENEPLEKGPASASSVARASRVAKGASDLKAALGYTAPCKRPAGRPLKKGIETSTSKAALGKASNAKALEKAAATPLEKGERAPWWKIKKTCAKKPERSYLTGTTEIGSKLKLIVEVTQKRCPAYLQVIDDIKASLEKNALTKEEALELREELCRQHGC